MKAKEPMQFCQKIPRGRLTLTCRRVAVRDGYCLAHHPETIARKRTERTDRIFRHESPAARREREHQEHLNDLVDGIGEALGVNMVDVSIGRLAAAREVAKRRTWRLRVIGD